MNGRPRKRNWQDDSSENASPNQPSRIDLIAELMAKLNGVDIVADFFHIRRLKLLIADCLPDHKEQMLRILINCLNRPPSPATASYATIVGLLNHDFHPLIVECLDVLMGVHRKAILNGKWENARGLLQFFKELRRCFSIDGH